MFPPPETPVSEVFQGVPGRSCATGLAPGPAGRPEIIEHTRADAGSGQRQSSLRSAAPRFLLTAGNARLQTGSLSLPIRRPAWWQATVRPVPALSSLGLSVKQMSVACTHLGW